jgi:hypothetical protein
MNLSTSLPSYIVTIVHPVRQAIRLDANRPHIAAHQARDTVRASTYLMMRLFVIFVGQILGRRLANPIIFPKLFISGDRNNYYYDE